MSRGEVGQGRARKNLSASRQERATRCISWFKAPCLAELQFATYGGAQEFHYDLDDFESSSDTWARRTGGISTEIRWSNAEPNKPFRGNCASYFTGGLNFRNFEMSNRNFEATQSRGGFYTRDFPKLCLALKKEFADTPISMLVYTRSLLEQQRNNGEQYYSRTDNWRTIDINTCLAAPADKKTAVRPSLIELPEQCVVHWGRVGEGRPVSASPASTIRQLHDQIKNWRC